MQDWPRAVIFDFDGTLVDSYPAITASINHVRGLRGLGPLEEAEVRRHVGRGAVHLLRQTVPGGDVDEDLARYRAHHPSVLREGTQLLPDVDLTLRGLRKKGLRLGLCSNKPGPFTRALLDHLGIAALFEVVIGPEDAPQIKPAPDMLRKALARLAVEPAQALYVGDMTVDIQTARAASVPVWVVATGSDDRSTLIAAKPDRLLEGIGELKSLPAVHRT